MRNKRIPTEAIQVMTVDEHVKPADTDGALVRMKPSAKVDKESLQRKVEQVKKHALAVKVMPRPASSKVVLPQGTSYETMPKKTRAFVVEMLMASSSQRKTELLEYINKLADKEGI